MYVTETVVCPYQNKCTVRGISCETCGNNTGKRNYYIPACYPDEFAHIKGDTECIGIDWRRYEGTNSNRV